MLRHKLADGVSKPAAIGARRVSLKALRDILRSADQKVRLFALDLISQQLGVFFVGQAERPAVFEPVLQQTWPARDRMIFDQLISRGGNRNAGTGNDHDPALRNVFLELLDKSLLIHVAPPTNCGVYTGWPCWRSIERDAYPVG